MRQAKNNSITHKIQLKWTKQSFNKVAKQQIMIRALIPADNEEMNFLHENKLPKDLKSKRSGASFTAKPRFTIYDIWLILIIRGSSFKQLEPSKSLENTENCT